MGWVRMDGMRWGSRGSGSGSGRETENGSRQGSGVGFTYLLTFANVGVSALDCRLQSQEPNWLSQYRYIYRGSERGREVISVPVP